MCKLLPESSSYYGFKFHYSTSILEEMISSVNPKPKIEERIKLAFVMRRWQKDEIRISKLLINFISFLISHPRVHPKLSEIRLGILFQKYFFIKFPILVSYEELQTLFNVKCFSSFIIEQTINIKVLKIN